MYKIELCTEFVTKSLTMLTVSSSILALLALFQGSEGAVNARLRIVNGNTASLGEFPYQVSLQLNGNHNCGGSIINQYYILTAAHCVDKTQWNQYKAVVGTVDLRRPGATHQVVQAHIHEQYVEASGWKNDIAILKVDTPFKFNSYVAPAELASAGQVLQENQEAVISGFGRVSDGGPLSTVLNKATVYIVNQEECKKVHTQDPVRPTNVCARNANKTTGFCKGDSGGPLTVDGRVVGIVSFTLDNGCASQNRYPQVYTRVSEYLNWIKDITG